MPNPQPHDVLSPEALAALDVLVRASRRPNGGPMSDRTDLIARLRLHAQTLTWMSATQKADVRDIAADVEKAADALSARGGWQDIATAPKDGREIIVVTARGSAVRVAWQAIDDDTHGWCAVNEGEHPESWTEGFCWEVNADYEQSDPPVSWIDTQSEADARKAAPPGEADERT